MVPFSGAQCSVNGVVVSEPSKLNQGEQLISASASALPDLLEFDSAASLASRRRHFTGQDQHVSLQPSEGSSQTAGETEGEHAPPPPLARLRTAGLTECVSSSERSPVHLQPVHDRPVPVLRESIHRHALQPRVSTPHTPHTPHTPQTQKRRRSNEPVSSDEPQDRKQPVRMQLMFSCILTG